MTGPSLTSNAMSGGCYGNGQGKFVLVGAFGTIVQSADFGSHPPVAGADIIERFATQEVKVKVATLLANDTDDTVQTKLSDAQVLTLTGRLDAEAVPALEQQCEQSIASETRMLINVIVETLETQLREVQEGA